jgi:DNA-binding CsgD family transcriptional regulator
MTDDYDSPQMARAGVRNRGAGLIGREHECATLDRLLAAARNGASAALVVRGEAGIGKSALLDEAAERAGDFTVLRAAGFEAEADLAFAGVFGLLRPVLGHLDDVPEMQARALAGALGLAPSDAPDRFMVSAAVLGLLAAAAERRPVVCLVDDAQWLDRPSAETLVFAARRLAADRVAMVFAAREGEARHFDAPGVPSVTLAPLDPTAAEMLLATRGEAATPAVRTRLLAEAHGNPLALLELPVALTDAQLAGSSPLPDAIPLTPRLRTVFRQRIEGLPEATQTVLLLAAADETGDLATVLVAADRLGLAPDALEPAELVELIRISGDTVTFRHPLVRSALYDSATASRRQQVHAALASAFRGDEHADRRVWHQAMATLSPDEEVAAALEAAARRARGRAAHASAASALLRAAELSTDEDRRRRRLAAAAKAAWDGGQPDRARACIAAVLPQASGEMRADLLGLSGVIESRAGDVHAALRLLLECAEQTAEPSKRLEALAEAAEMVSFAGEYERAIEFGALAAQITPLTARDAFLVSLMSLMAASAAGEYGRARAAMDEVVAGAATLDDPRDLIWAVTALWAAPELVDAVDYAERAVDLARAQGLVSLLPVALRYQAAAELSRNHFERAQAAAEEAYRLFEDIGQTWGTSSLRATLSAIALVRGDLDAARRHSEAILATGRERGAPFLIAIANWRLGQIALVAGRPEEATDHLLRASATGTPESHPMVGMRLIPEVVEAALAAGREAEARDAFARYDEWVTRWPSDTHVALRDRTRALLDPAHAEAFFTAALANAAALPTMTRARTELLFGEWLRRERRRQDARTHLRTAAELFRQLGTPLWEERATAELRATGETTRKRDPSTIDELTPQELQIAGLVAEGKTNREIATQLFLSPRTIDYHLRKVFSKLGISSRTELVRSGLPDRRRDE